MTFDEAVTFVPLLALVGLALRFGLGVSGWVVLAVTAAVAVIAAAIAAAVGLWRDRTAGVEETPEHFEEPRERAGSAGDPPPEVEGHGHAHEHECRAEWPPL